MVDALPPRWIPKAIERPLGAARVKIRDRGPVPQIPKDLEGLRRLTGIVPPNSKFAGSSGDVDQRLHEAEACYRADRDVLHPVALL